MLTTCEILSRWPGQGYVSLNLDRKGFLQCCLNCWYLAVMQTTLENSDCKFIKEFNLFIIRTMTNGSLLIVKTQLSSWIWSFRLTLRPVSKVLNIGCEAVSIFIYKAMQHVRANKELSILYLAKKLDKMFFFYLRDIHSETWQVVKDVIILSRFLSMRGKLVQTKRLNLEYR